MRRPKGRWRLFARLFGDALPERLEDWGLLNEIKDVNDRLVALVGDLAADRRRRLPGCLPGDVRRAFDRGPGSGPVRANRQAARRTEDMDGTP